MPKTVSFLCLWESHDNVVLELIKEKNHITADLQVCSRNSANKTKQMEQSQ